MFDISLQNMKVWRIYIYFISSPRFLNVKNCYKIDIKTKERKKDKKLNINMM